MIRNRPRSVLITLSFVIATVPLVTPEAAAAVGDLTPQGCIDDNDSGPDACALSTDGLNDARGVAVSDDGRSVYVAARLDDAVVMFDRDTQTGALTPAGCIDDNDTGADLCDQSADGLDEPRGVVVSQDGESVYVVSQDDDAVAIFDRDIQTGALTPAGCIDDNDSGADACGQSADGLNVARAIAVTSDGTSVYVVGREDDALVTFDRDTETGALTPAGCIDDNDTGADSCAQSTDGLNAARGVSVSQDGQSVYVVGQEDDAVVIFDRDTQTGALTPAGCIDDNDSGADACAASADGLDEATGVAVSPNGASVYVASLSDDAVVTFDRDTQTGALTPAGCIDDNDTGVDTCALSADGLDGANGVVVSEDGLSVYAASFDDDAVAIFDRDTQTGALTPAGCIDDNDSGADTCGQSADGLNAPSDVVVSSDGRSVYVAAVDDDAVVRFDREGSSDTDPPETTIKGPKKASNRRPSFRLESDEPGSTFMCKLDKKPFKACTSPYRTRRLSLGQHVLKVKATDASGNTDPTPAKKTFKVVKKN